MVLIAFALLFAMTAVLATSLTNLAGDLPRYESNLREKARSLKFATSGGDTIEKAANVLKDLRTELQQPQQSSLTNSMLRTDQFRLKFASQILARWIKSYLRWPY